jgi:hypothetical protein
MVENATGAFHNGKPKPQAWYIPGAGIEALKFFENQLLPGFRDADTGIMNLDPDMLAIIPTSNQHTSLICVFYCIPDKVLENAYKHLAIGSHFDIG